MENITVSKKRALSKDRALTFGRIQGRNPWPTDRKLQRGKDIIRYSLEYYGNWFPKKDISQKKGGQAIINNKDFNIESLHQIYKELVDIIGIDKTLKMYKNYKGLQVNFPKRLYDRDYVINQAIEADKKGQSLKHLAIKYDYSERWIREMILQKPIN